MSHLSNDPSDVFRVSLGRPPARVPLVRLHQDEDVVYANRQD